MKPIEFLVVGAGPYGIASAAHAKFLGVETVVVGKPLDFWKTNMPRGMFLRSGPDWHLDAREVCTFEAYLQTRGLAHAQIKPVSLELFLDYASWFTGQYDLATHNAHVMRLRRKQGAYIATLDDGTSLGAQNVLLGLGFSFFKHYPRELVEKLPIGSYTHTCDTVDFEFYRGKRVLIVGGRQSAFEWAALINEKSADEIHITHRHATPRFEESDWSWVQPMVRRTLDDHSWWRKLALEDQEKIRQEFWTLGRLKLEAWLDARIHQPTVTIHEKTNIVAVNTRDDKTYDVRLDNKVTLNVHHILLATGYRPEMRNVAFLDRATILDQLELMDGFPVLDPEFQTNLSGLYISGLASTRDFGPFFGFTVGCPVTAKIIGEAVSR